MGLVVICGMLSEVTSSLFLFFRMNYKLGSLPSPIPPNLSPFQRGSPRGTDLWPQHQPALPATTLPVVVTLSVPRTHRHPGPHSTSFQAGIFLQERGLPRPAQLLLSSQRSETQRSSEVLQGLSWWCLGPA